MENRTWRLLELYPEYKNKDVLSKLSSKNIKYFIITENFIKVNITDLESKDFETMAFIHHDISNQNF